MTRRGSHLPVALLAVLVSACGPEPMVRPLSVGDLAFFEAEVTPHLSERCASGGCHGDPERPLSLYAPGAHRQDAARLHLDEPLSPAEVLANARRVRAFALTERARDSLMVKKPLAPGAGGLWHGGGDVFLDDRDAACAALVQWLDAPIALDGGAP